MDQSTATEPATLTRRAGPSGLRLGWTNVRNNWLTLVFLVVVWGGYYDRNNDWSSTVTMLSWTVGGVFVGATLFYGLYGLSTVRLTRDELVVIRFGVRQRLLRDEVGHLVRGSAYPTVGKSRELHYWFITDVRGRRFVALPDSLFRTTPSRSWRPCSGSGPDRSPGRRRSTASRRGGCATSC